MRYIVPLISIFAMLACGAPAALLPTVTKTPQDAPTSTPTQISRHVTGCWYTRTDASLDAEAVGVVCDTDVTILARFGGWAMVERGLWVCARAWGERVKCK